MRKLSKYVVITVLFSPFCKICVAGPSVIVNPKSASVKIRDNKFVFVQELKNPKQIKIIQEVFFRAKRIDDTASSLKTHTHKIEFSDRWLIDINRGEFGVLTKVITDV